MLGVLVEVRGRGTRWFKGSLRIRVAVLATTLAATPAEATPGSTSGVLRHTQAQITLKPPHRASHRADEVENVVLVACRDQLPKQAILLACISRRLNKPQIHFRTLPLKPPHARQAGNEVGLETWCKQTQRRSSDRLDRPYSQQADPFRAGAEPSLASHSVTCRSGRMFSDVGRRRVDRSDRDLRYRNDALSAYVTRLTRFR